MRTVLVIDARGEDKHAVVAAALPHDADMRAYVQYCVDRAIAKWPLDADKRIDGYDCVTFWPPFAPTTRIEVWLS
jgi:hypothetical protein